MKNTYLTSYFPLLSIVLFSLSLAIRTEVVVIDFLKQLGIYSGMLEFFSEGGIKLSLLLLLLIIFFMVFAALKLVANTINEVSLLFFSKESEGDSLKQIRAGSIIYFIGAALSLFSIYSFLGIAMIFAITTIGYFIYFVYKISTTLSPAGLIGIIFFHIFIWCGLFLIVFLTALKLYNTLIASLPI